MEPSGELAERWDVEEDGAVYRFTLRDGVTWHDGTPFTSADVKSTFDEMLLKLHGRARASIAPALAGIETPDPKTVVFRFKAPYAPLLQQLNVTEAPILPRHIYEGTDVATNPANNAPAGTGPFKFVSYTQGAETRMAATPAVVVAVLADVLAPGDPFTSVARPLQPPSWSHPMGTDDFGRDVLAGVVHGVRTSMVVVGRVMLIAGVLGVAVGAVAGYFGGVLDDLLMRVTDLFQSVPRFFLAVLVVALFGAGLDNLILVLAVSTWPWLARVVRADVLSMREREFVTASRALGASDPDPGPERGAQRAAVGHRHGLAAGVDGDPPGGRPRLHRPRRPGRHELGVPDQQRPALSRVACWMSVFPARRSPSRCSGSTSSATPSTRC